MPRRLTTEEFVERARAVHADRYDYSLVEYVGNRSKVTISCRDHGPFEQTPNNHFLGKGCPDCSGNRRITTRVFIKKAIAVHGDRYDYSEVDYVNFSTKVTINCSIHGAFLQRPDHHLSGVGCPDCGSFARALALSGTTEEFIQKAKAVHGDRYDYSKAQYVRAHEKVTIICPDHGPFEQTPANHCKKKPVGCPDCGGSKQLTSQSFIEKARAIHGGRYGYSNIEYVNAHKKVTIICPDHGPFEQTPASHCRQNSVGCPRCAHTVPLDTATFVQKAEAVHGDRYDYSRVQYVRAHEKVTIICPDHGPFQQRSAAHLLQNAGCPDCAESGFNPNEPGLLYYIAITTDDGDTRYKIGITNRTVEDRFLTKDLARIRIVRTWRFKLGRHAAEREAEILKQCAGDRYFGPDILMSGNTEIFSHDVLGLDE